MHEEGKRKFGVFLIDDHPAVREGLALLLVQDGHVVCGEAENVKDALKALDGCGADIVLVDVSLGDESGLDVIVNLRKRKIPSLVYSIHEDSDTVERAFNSGAKGYVTKREVSGILLEAVRQVIAGQRYVSPRAAQSLANRVLSPPEPAREESLSDREQQIMTRLGQGHSKAEIAAELVIGTRTVETYCSRIIEKLGVKGMKELRKYAILNR